MPSLCRWSTSGVTSWDDAIIGSYGHVQTERFGLTCQVVLSSSMLEIWKDDTWKVRQALFRQLQSQVGFMLYSCSIYLYRRREHFQWNMDVWGVSGVEAEAELLAAITTFFKRVGLTSKNVGKWKEKITAVVLVVASYAQALYFFFGPMYVGIKVNSRGVLGEVLTALGVPESKFAATCVLVDKLEKVRRRTFIPYNLRHICSCVCNMGGGIHYRYRLMPSKVTWQPWV